MRIEKKEKEIKLLTLITKLTTVDNYYFDKGNAQLTLLTIYVVLSSFNKSTRFKTVFKLFYIISDLNRRDRIFTQPARKLPEIPRNSKITRKFENIQILDNCPIIRKSSGKSKIYRHFPKKKTKIIRKSDHYLRTRKVSEITQKSEATKKKPLHEMIIDPT